MTLIPNVLGFPNVPAQDALQMPPRSDLSCGICVAAVHAAVELRDGTAVEQQPEWNGNAANTRIRARPASGRRAGEDLGPIAGLLPARTTMPMKRGGSPAFRRHRSVCVGLAALRMGVASSLHPFVQGRTKRTEALNDSIASP